VQPDISACQTGVTGIWIGVGGAVSEFTFEAELAAIKIFGGG
jgi:hypothetical protein